MKKIATFVLFSFALGSGMVFAQTARVASSVSLSFGSTNSDGSDASLQAKVTGQNPTGRVSFELATPDGPVSICADVQVSTGRANCPIPAQFRRAGTRRYQARYSGDANNYPSSAVVSAGITNGTGVFGAQVLPATVSVTVSPSRIRAGQAFVVSATVVSGVGGGVVSFKGIPGCNIVLAQPLLGSDTTAVANCTVSEATAGALDITADFAGGITDPPVTGSGTLRLNVLPAVGPRDYTDMWWAGKAEDGWGMSITQHGDTQFNALYVYSDDGSPTWYVMPGGTWSEDFTRYQGALYRPRGTPYFAYDASALTVGASVGTATIDFTSASTATLRYSINGVSGSKSITRQPFGVADAAEKLRVSDLWWAGIEQNGWGINIAQSDRTLFAVWYTYDAIGNATWYVMPGGTWSGADYTGKLYSTKSSAWLGTAYLALQMRATEVGEATISFLDPNIATARLRVGETSRERLLFRQSY